MNAIGQQGQSPARFKIDPQANSCEPLMTNRIFSIEIAAQSTRMHHTLQRPMIAILDFTVEQTSALSIIFGGGAHSRSNRKGNLRRCRDIDRPLKAAFTENSQSFYISP
ncbi:hypothetical protein [Ochrobactrum sp. CGA5]|uniref:hypothetical protein n=1 Tax=Ochrobactrum sp. CGA5 TaxID=2583453 RepID=UPI0015D5E775